MAKLVELSDDSTADAVLRRSIDQQILLHTVRINDLSNADNGGGTGVTIEKNGRFFVVTAAHVLSDGHSFAALLRDGISNEFDHFVGVYRNEVSDVAAIEIHPDYVEQFKDWHGFLSEQDYYLGRYPSAKVPITITGYAGMAMERAGEFQSSDSSSVHLINVSSLSYVTNAIQKTKWPRKVAFQRRIDNDRDIFFDYRRGPQEVTGRDMR